MEMDDLTLLFPDVKVAEIMLERLDDLMSWTRMEFKPKKSHSLVLRKGKVVSNHIFMLSGDEILTVCKQPRKIIYSSGRLYMYMKDNKDTNRVKELHHDLDDWLTRIDKCGLPNRFKL